MDKQKKGFSLPLFLPPSTSKSWPLVMCPALFRSGVPAVDKTEKMFLSGWTINQQIYKLMSGGHRLCDGKQSRVREGPTGRVCIRNSDRGSPWKGALFDKGLNEEKKNVWGRTFQTVGAARAKTLRGNVPGGLGAARRSEWQKQREQGGHGEATEQGSEQGGCWRNPGVRDLQELGAGGDMVRVLF